MSQDNGSGGIFRLVEGDRTAGEHTSEGNVTADELRHAGGRCRNEATQGITLDETPHEAGRPRCNGDRPYATEPKPSRKENNG